MVYLKFYFALLFLWGEEIIEFFHSLPMLILVLLLVYWRFQEALVLGVMILSHSMWECLLCLILLLNQLKNQFQDLVVEILCFLDFLKEMVLSKFFLWVVLFVYFDRCDLYSSILFCHFIGLICSVDFVSFLCRLCRMDGFNIIIVKEF